MVISSTDCHLYLERALSSIGNEQTCRPSEYVFVRNGSLHEKANKLLLAFARQSGYVVKFEDLPEMNTLSDALNQGLLLCSFALVARMDPDDIAMPTRFEKQLEEFHANPNVDICGTFIGEFDGELASAKQREMPLSHASIVATAKWRNPLAHPTVMFKRQVILDIGGYPQVDKAQDYLLWVKAIVEGYTLVNIPEQLLFFRSGSSHIRRRGWAYFIHEVAVFRQMREIGFLSRWRFWATVSLRAFVRLQPVWIRKVIYRVRN